MDKDEPEISDDWKGTDLAAIYGRYGPWNNEVSPIHASKYHAVLFHLPAKLDSPPKPHYNSHPCHWDDDHVKMPFSSENLFPVKNENGESMLKPRWSIIQRELLQPIHNSKELEEAVHLYNSKLPKFLALHYFFENVLDEDESEHFFSSVLPGIIQLALRLPNLIPGSLPLLKKGLCRSISLSQLQLASLLANGFLCTFPWRKDMATYPGFNFVRLFAAHLRPKKVNAVSEKLKCICHYFRRIISKEPVGVVTFERKFIPRSHMPRWDKLENILGNTRLHISSIGTIENNGLGLLQVDFANKNVGGGVLGFGCVQEEIRYVICPELIVGRLFTEQLTSNEALIVTGVERYSNYEGYGDTFTWAGDHKDETPFNKNGQRCTTITAIDAIHFSNQTDQYDSSFILRELNKAYAGFHSRNDFQLPAVATGNWGCGAFKGDSNLKSLIQLMACSAAKRDMVYFTFGDQNLQARIHDMYLFLATNQITIVQLWRLLCRFSSAKLKPDMLYNFIQQTFLDSKNQLSIKHFFSCANRKVESEQEKPSTSAASRFFLNKSQCHQEKANLQDNLQMEAHHRDSSPDIIESSQNDNCTLSKKHKVVDNRNDTNNLAVNNHSEIINFMNLLDGEPRRTIKSDENCNTNHKMPFLTLDGYNKKHKKDERDDDPQCPMDVDEVLCEMPMEANSEMDGVGSKRKITDYFVKAAK